MRCQITRRTLSGSAVVIPLLISAEDSRFYNGCAYFPLRPIHVQVQGDMIATGSLTDDFGVGASCLYGSVSRHGKIVSGIAICAEAWNFITGSTIEYITSQNILRQADPDSIIKRLGLETHSEGYGRFVDIPGVPTEEYRVFNSDGMFYMIFSDGRAMRLGSPSALFKIIKGIDESLLDERIVDCALGGRKIYDHLTSLACNMIERGFRAYYGRVQHPDEIRDLVSLVVFVSKFGVPLAPSLFFGAVNDSSLELESVISKM